MNEEILTWHGVRSLRQGSRTELENTATGFKTTEINWEASDLREELANSTHYCDLILSGPRSRKSAKQVASFIMLSIGRKKNRDKTIRCGKMPKTAKNKSKSGRDSRATWCPR